MSPDITDVPDRRRTTARLGIFVEGVYGEIETPGGRAVAAIPEVFGFLVFAWEVARPFETLTLIGRRSAGLEELHPLPVGPRLAALPHYPSLRHAGAIARALPRSALALWRGLSGVDIVWVFGPHPLGVLAIALARLRGKAVVLGVRQHPTRYHESRLSEVSLPATRATARLLDRVYRRLVRRFPTVVVGDELAAYYAGGRAPLLPIVVSLIREGDLRPPRTPSAGGSIELVTVGRIDREKNPRVLVDAVAALDRAQPGRFRLRWVGSGPLAEATRAYAAESGVDRWIDFVGFVPFGPDLLDMYRRAEIFVHVALTEGVPQTLVEAMASGCAIVATDVGGVRSVLGDGEAGLLVSPGNHAAVAAAVRRLADDPDLRASLAQRAVERAGELTIEKESRRVADFIHRYGVPVRDGVFRRGSRT